MNGLQSVLTRIGQGILRLATCPPGARGGIVARRLTHATVPLRATTGLRSASSATSSPSHDTQAKTLGPQKWVNIVGDSHSSRRNRSGPLDSRLTGLEIVRINTRPTPIQALYSALLLKDDALTWDRFAKLVGSGYVRYLPPLAFSAVLGSLRPRHSASLPHRHRLRPNGQTQLVSRRANYHRGIRRKVTLLENKMAELGYRFTLWDYHHLLEIARSGRNWRLAVHIWSKMERDNVEPDTWCYNTYMATVCRTAGWKRWTKVTEPAKARRLRKFPGPSDETGRKRDVRARALGIFRSMVERGVAPNSMTYDLLILAMARVGDRAGIIATLQSAWGLAFRDDGQVVRLEKPVLVKSSPLWPTKHTALAIAEAFGMMCQPKVGLRAIQCMHEHFDTPIYTQTWVALLNWSYAWASGSMQRLAPATAAEYIWKIMTNPPHDVRPTLDMYDYIVRSLIWRGKSRKPEQLIDEGIELYRQLAEKYRVVYRDLRHLRGDEEAVAAKLQRDLVRYRSMIRRWVELFIMGRGKESYREFARRKVPDAIGKWQFFLSNCVVYFIHNGYVCLELGDERKWKEMKVRRRTKPRLLPLGTGSKEEDDF